MRRTALPGVGAFYSMNLNPIRRRSEYKYTGRKVKSESLRYTLILDGAVMKYADGREVCQPSMKGAQEYRRRIQAMAERQEQICCICHDEKNLLKAWDTTFEHVNGRGMNASWRDDRIEDENGQPLNGAAHFDCNMRKGSKRIVEKKGSSDGR
jgi:hypothetical protein